MIVRVFTASSLLQVSLLLTAPLLTNALPAATLFSIATFKGDNGDAPNTAPVVAGDGSVYGTTFNGGEGFYGIVFGFKTNEGLATLFSFATLTNPDSGAYPDGDLALATDGHLYGTTFASGRTGGSGTVFCLIPGGGITNLHTFAPEIFVGGLPSYTNADGSHPSAGLSQAIDGTFYGTTGQGGPKGTGTLFKITTNGNFHSLFSFDAMGDDGSGNYEYTNFAGVGPQALLFGPDGNLYGAAGNGGAGGTGTIFRATTNGAVAVLFAFNPAIYDSVTGFYSNTTGAFPSTHLALGSDGSLFGTCSDGGSNLVGTAFKLSTNGAFTLLHAFAPGDYDQENHFTNADGAIPLGGLAAGRDGSFYGTTRDGGPTGSGTIFRITKDGTLTTLFQFAPGNYNEQAYTTNADGIGPTVPPVEADDGIFYGVTTRGGAYGRGTLYKLDTRASTSQLFIALHSNSVVLTCPMRFPCNSRPP
jgi:uncharacterized repeat protein (TIGR03803 family)